MGDDLVKLDSYEIETSVLETNKYSEENTTSTEGEMCFSGSNCVPDDYSPWCYIRVQSRMAKRVQEQIAKRFPTFVHDGMSIGLIDKKNLNKKQASVLSGYVFVQAEGNNLQAFFKQEGMDLYVAYDCATHKFATIPARTMNVFMHLSHTSGCTIYFVHQDYEQYAKGNTLVHVQSGILQGLEGYIVRFHRDRLLVIRLSNGLTIALTGIHKCTFESVKDIQMAQDLGLISK